MHYFKQRYHSSALFQAGGSGRSLGTATNEDTHLIWWYRLGRQSAYLHFFQFRLWRPAKPRTGMTTRFVVRFHQSAVLFALFDTYFMSIDSFCTQSELRFKLAHSGNWQFGFRMLISDPYGGHEHLPHEYWASVANSLLPLNSRRVRFLVFGVVVTTDAFHNKIRKVVSVQVCVCGGVCGFASVYACARNTYVRHGTTMKHSPRRKGEHGPCDCVSCQDAKTTQNNLITRTPGPYIDAWRLPNIMMNYEFKFMTSFWIKCSSSSIPQKHQP